MRVFTKSEFCTLFNKSSPILHKLHEIYFTEPNTIKNHNHVAQTIFLCDFRKQSAFSICSEHTLCTAHGRAEPGEPSPSALGKNQRKFLRFQGIPGRAPLSSVWEQKVHSPELISSSWGILAGPLLLVSDKSFPSQLI